MPRKMGDGLQWFFGHIKSNFTTGDFLQLGRRRTGGVIQALLVLVYRVSLRSSPTKRVPCQIISMLNALPRPREPTMPTMHETGNLSNAYDRQQATNGTAASAYFQEFTEALNRYHLNNYRH